MGIAKPYSQYIFLLGGHDLEMQEIRNILEAKGLNFFDFNLEWGAKLSSYSAVFDGEHIFVGIELIIDCLKPVNYIDIDHHNEKSHLPSSIEQVAEFLCVELNRWQKLVAANDKGYIPAMEKINATNEEIEEIRLQDRKNQGTTAQDECLGLQSINLYLEEYGELKAVESLTARFATITDRLYPVPKLIITHVDQLVYYGNGIKVLSQYFKRLISEKKAFYGGGNIGFFGVAKDNFTSDQIKELKMKVIELIESV